MSTPTNEPGPGLANFFSDHYQQHNGVRLRHLESLGLPLTGRRVLELGSGPGDHTGFYVRRGCEVVSVDSRRICLDVLKQRFPYVQTLICDLNAPSLLRTLGPFDVVHCYGVLYHLEDPTGLLACMGESCNGFSIIETCVSAGDTVRIDLVEEILGDYTQSSTGRGSRPTRKWVFAQLGVSFPFVYHTRTQPAHPEFPTEWNNLSAAHSLIRSVFVASKYSLNLPTLSPVLLNVQEALA
jgi:SAM-dependent methyltransferase